MHGIPPSHQKARSTVEATEQLVQRARVAQDPELRRMLLQAGCQLLDASLTALEVDRATLQRRVEQRASDPAVGGSGTGRVPVAGIVAGY